MWTSKTIGFTRHFYEGKNGSYRIISYEEQGPWYTEQLDRDDPQKGYWALWNSDGSPADFMSLEEAKAFIEEIDEDPDFDYT